MNEQDPSSLCRVRLAALRPVALRPGGRRSGRRAARHRHAGMLGAGGKVTPTVEGKAERREEPHDRTATGEPPRRRATVCTRGEGTGAIADGKPTAIIPPET